MQSKGMLISCLQIIETGLDKIAYQFCVTDIFLQFIKLLLSCELPVSIANFEYQILMVMFVNQQ